MECPVVQPLIDAWVDGELDADMAPDFQSHLDQCPACIRIVEQRRMLKSLSARRELYQAAPPMLLERIRGAIRDEVEGVSRVEEIVRTGAIGLPSRTIAPRPHAVRWRRPVALAAGVMILIGLNALILSQTMRGRGDSLAGEVIAAHVRSLDLESHLMDVTSTDRHTVKPWFQGKIDYSPPVEDLTDRGFKLAGGRLDYLNHRTVAALVYRRGLHVINLFVWPTTLADAPVRTAQQNGYHVLHWSRDGTTWWAVSDLNELELREFADLLQSARNGPATRP